MSNALTPPTNVRLTKRSDRVLAEIDGAEAVPVQLVYAQPVSQRDGQISLMNVKRKKELAWLDSLDELDPDSRKIAEAALHEGYRIGVICKVTESRVNHGHRYMRVETLRGSNYFNLKEPGKNVSWLTPDRVVIRDSMGNRYEVPSIAALDAESKAHLDRVL